MKNVAIVLIAAALLASACATSKTPSKNPSRGFKTLEATVVEREREAPGSGTASFAGNGNFYLVFEARDGEATVRYRFQVTQAQYSRFVEGTRVQILVADDQLREIRRIP
ncbi:MAG: hypothetical protein M3R62_15775 [Acidobacteriota bacterium]|nr:hypothetical protein [Acidobacteriota bacterium]MDQ2980668.1 hypothetical protein [Acidobacteriota bacterium]